MYNDRQTVDTTVRFRGRLQETVNFIAETQLKDAALWARFVSQYRTHADDDGAWRGEYWGKMMVGAALVCAYTRDEALYALLRGTVEEMLAAADGAGRISTYSVEKEFTGWDIWCRKYVLMGMQSFLDICREPELSARLIASMRGQVDYLIARIGEGKIDITETTGFWRGLASSSILEPVVRLYTLTGEPRYRDFAAYIIRRGGTSVADVFTLAAEDTTDPYQYPITKAYEMISCFEGLLEFGVATGNREYIDTAVKFARRVMNAELTAIGCAGCVHEYFDHAAARQTDTAYKGLMQETCVTVTWMRFCAKLLLHTGDPVFADRFEQSLYNAYLGAINTQRAAQPAAPLDLLPFDSYSPLLPNRRGRGVGGHLTMADGHCYGCCACIGAVGIGLVPQIAATCRNDGVVLNLYVPGSITTRTATLTVDTAYPSEGRVTVTVETEGEFSLTLRIPGWSEDARLAVNGEAQPVEKGYHTLTRCWQRGDTVVLELDMRTRLLHPAPVARDVIITDVKWEQNYMVPRVVTPSPDAERFVALRRGPLVLARDARLGAVAEPVDIAANVDCVQVTETDAPFPATVALRVPQRDGTAFTVVDYASAGKTWGDDSALACWLPMKI